MKGHFGRIGRPRSNIIRERALFIGGGMLAFVLISMGMLINGSEDSKARSDIQPNSGRSSETATLGSINLLAPDTEVSQGMQLSRVTLREMPWPRDKVPAGAIRASDVGVKELFAKVSLPANVPITRDALTDQPVTNSLVNLLPPGNRAVTIEVDAKGGVEGWATAGAHVDVSLTYLDAETNQQKSTIPVEDAVVLSFNGTTQKIAESDGGASAGKIRGSSATVTLSVPAEDALRINTASAMGTLRLLLRGAGDIKSSPKTTVTADDVGGGIKEKPKAVAAAPCGSAKIRNPDGSYSEYSLCTGQGWARKADTGEL